jgi:ribonuclease VapC
VIVVDSSALIAIIDNEPGRDACVEVLAGDADIVMSAGTLAEALIVASGRRMEAALEMVVDNLEIAVDPVTYEVALDVGRAYRRWGKGFHPARLNYGDCFAYVTAKAWNAPLLFVGDEFSQTDVRSAL